MKNLLLGYFHTPDRNRMDAIHAIGSVLGFTQEDFHKVRNFRSQTVANTAAEKQTAQLSFTSYLFYLMALFDAQSFFF